MKKNIFPELLSIGRGGKTGAVPAKFQLPDLTLASTGTVRMSGLLNSETFPASFMIEAQGKVIYIDPFVVDEGSKPADYIFITHAHMDHLSLPDIKRIAVKDTVIVCPGTAVKKLAGYNVKEVKPGDVLELGNIKCEVVASYNIAPAFLWVRLHPKKNKHVGYVLTINKLRVYHAGDTDYIPEMKDIKNITVALIPIGTGKTCMTPEQAADLINNMKPAAAIPMHYQLGKGAAQKFKSFVDKSVQVVILQDGE